jgi:sulfite reductase (NADPH) flavoprotein alpha-component
VKTSYALSREAGAYRYVQDIVTAQGAALAQDLSEGAVIMLCGSLAMQRGVFAAFEDVLQDAGEQTLEDYRAAGQVLIDCY